MDLVKKLIMLILIFLMIDFFVGSVLSNFSKASQIRYSRLYGEKLDADVLFVGNSRAVNSFYAPYFNEITGLDAFNLGYNGLTLSLSKMFLDDYFERNELPKVLFLEVTCLKDDSSIISNFKQYLPFSRRLRNMMKTIHPHIYYTGIFSKSFLFNSEYFFRSLYYLRSSDQTWINRYVMNQDMYSKLNVDSLGRLLDAPRQSNIDLLNELVRTYSNKGIEIVLVLAPVINKARDEQLIVDFIGDIEERSGLEVLDLSREVDGFKNFSDASHTNYGGAKIISERLAILPVIKALRRENVDSRQAMDHKRKGVSSSLRNSQ